ncbi:unnamed protein product, partial [marine sediment metagenome]
PSALPGTLGEMTKMRATLKPTVNRVARRGETVRLAYLPIIPARPLEGGYKPS